MMTRTLCLGLFAVALFAVEVGSAWADVPPGPRPIRPDPLPPPAPTPPLPPPAPIDVPSVLPTPKNGEKAPPQPEMWPSDPVPPPKPKRTGPFRSCGSGVGLGLVGIGIAWGLMWV